MIFEQHFTKDIQGWADNDYKIIGVFQGDESALTRAYILTDSGNKTDTGLLKVQVRKLATDATGDEVVYSETFDIAGRPERWFILAEINQDIRQNFPIVLEVAVDGIPTTNTQLLFITVQFERKFQGGTPEEYYQSQIEMVSNPEGGTDAGRV